jgi:hypothetical protein
MSKWRVIFLQHLICIASILSRGIFNILRYARLGCMDDSRCDSRAVGLRSQFRRLHFSITLFVYEHDDTMFRDGVKSISHVFHAVN